MKLRVHFQLQQAMLLQNENENQIEEENNNSNKQVGWLAGCLYAGSSIIMAASCLPIAFACYHTNQCT